MPSGPVGKAFTFVGGSNLMMFKSSKNQNEAWALIKYLSSDAVQKDYADLLSFFPARLAPQEQVGNSDANHKAFFSAIKEGRTYAPIAQWGQIENAYKGRFGQHPRLRCGAGQALQRGRGQVAARCGGQGSRRPPRAGRLAPTTPSSRLGARAAARAPQGATPEP